MNLMGRNTWIALALVTGAVTFAGCSDENGASLLAPGEPLEQKSVVTPYYPGNHNGNDNGGTNENDNGGSGTCPDGSTQLRTDLGGSIDNRAEYEVFPSGCSEFRVRVRDLAEYTTYSVVVEGVTVGALTTDDRGRGELRYQTGGFPGDFPDIFLGDQVTVGPVSGTLASDCSSNGNCNG